MGSLQLQLASHIPTSTEAAASARKNHLR